MGNYCREKITKLIFLALTLLSEWKLTITSPCSFFYNNNELKKIIITSFVLGLKLPASLWKWCKSILSHLSKCFPRVVSDATNLSFIFNLEEWHQLTLSWIFLGPLTSGFGNLQANPAIGLGGSLGVMGTSSLGTPFGSASGLSSSGLTGGSGFGTPLGNSVLGATGLGATGFGTTTGFGTPSLGSTPGGTLSSVSTGLTGSPLGSGTSAFAQPKFQLQRPPAGNKRGKRRWGSPPFSWEKTRIGSRWEQRFFSHSLLNRLRNDKLINQGVCFNNLAFRIRLCYFQIFGPKSVRYIH